jgi:hypothetical protein
LTDTNLDEIVGDFLRQLQTAAVIKPLQAAAIGGRVHSGVPLD